MQYYPFDSRNKLYKPKFGAVPSGTETSLRILLHKDALVYNAYLMIKNDNQSDFLKIRLTEKEWLEDYRFYDFSGSFNEGLYFYYFVYESAYGTFCVKRQEHSLGVVSNEGKLWQLTVYDKDYKTPGKYLGGLIYQIFPDRFYFSGKEKECPADRYIHKDWNEEPEYLQNDSVKFLGNDYFSGDLQGITEKLPYLNSLGVTLIYLNPIFEAHSNHRYNTADYFKIDPLLGTKEDLENLCKKAKEFNIGIILDGVFSHTGDDSVYFNKYHRYKDGGAYNDYNSPYRPWYNFINYPNEYDSWWGISTLPEVNEDEPSYTNFITGKDGVIPYWLKCGVSGFRLDVADELPDGILDNIRKCMKDANPDSLLIGEVWEDATNKISHGGRRRFLRGKQLDTVMNYPFCEAIINFLNGGNSRDFLDAILDIAENYPPMSLNLLMNHIGTHDTARILTRLGKPNRYIGDRESQSKEKLSENEYLHAVKFLRLAAALQYTLPGIPSLYYGDEAGMQGYGDPFCRKTYPWGNENLHLIDFYKKLGKLRSENICFTDGEFIPMYANYGHVVYIRKKGNNQVLVAVNRWCDSETVNVPKEFDGAFPLFGTKSENGVLNVNAEDITVLIL